MAKPLTTLMEQHRSQLADQWPWIWLYEIEVPTDPPTRYRLTNYTRQVQFGTNSLGAPLIYYPFPIAHGGVEQNAGGDLRSIAVSVGNVSREMSQALSDFSGLIGQPVVIRLVNASELVNAQAQIREDSKIRGVRVLQRVVTFTLSPYNLYERSFPPFRINSTHCRHLYGGAFCGYDLTLGTLPTCAKTLEACELHGDDEVATGQVRKHPDRYGSHPSIAAPK